jgi:hypothetical protein
MNVELKQGTLQNRRPELRHSVGRLPIEIILFDPARLRERRAGGRADLQDEEMDCLLTDGALEPPQAYADFCAQW